MPTEAKEKIHTGIKFFPNNPLLSQLQAANNELVGPYLTASDVRALKVVAKGFKQEQFLLRLIEERGVLDPKNYIAEFKAKFDYVLDLGELLDALIDLGRSEENFEQYRKGDVPLFIAFNKNQPQVFARCIPGPNYTRPSVYFAKALSNLGLENAVNIIKDYVNYNLSNRTQNFYIQECLEGVLGEANKRWEKIEREVKIEINPHLLAFITILWGAGGMATFLMCVEGRYDAVLPDPLGLFLDLASMVLMAIIFVFVGDFLLRRSQSLYEFLHLKWKILASDDVRYLYNVVNHGPELRERMAQQVPNTVLSV